VIGIGNLAIVEVAAVRGAVGLRRIVGAVRVVEMQPEKKRASRSSLQPGERMGYALPGAPVDQTDILLLEGRRRKRIIVKIEAKRHDPNAVEHDGGDRGCG